MRVTPGAGRFCTSSPCRNLSIEIAAACPWATAQMMFLGPSAASPPKNTRGRLDCRVVASSTGMPHSSKAMPASRSIQGNAFSWPTATRTSSHSKICSGSPVETSWRLPLASRTARTLSKLMPVSLPSVWRKAFGTRQSRIGMPSWIASSFSHGDAFISSNGDRTITLTSLPPRRFELRQQSIAVLPPPRTMTRLPIDVTWPKDTDDSQSMPIWMREAASLRPGMSRSRRRARADEDGVPAVGEEGAHGVDPRAAAKLDAELEHVAGLLVDHFLGQAKARDLRTDHSARLGVTVEDDDFVAERRQVAGDGQRRRTATDAGDPLAVARRDARQVLDDVVLEVGGDALEAADRDRLGLGGLGFFDAAASTGGLA